MKKIISAILILLMLAPIASAAPEGMVFRLADAEYTQVGDQVTLTAKIENAPVCSSFRVFFTYDTETLEFAESKQLNTRGIFMVNKDATYSGQPAISVLSADAAKVFEGTADIFSLTFKIKKDITADNAPITLAFSEFYDADLAEVKPTIQMGKIALKSATAPDNSATDTPDGSDNNTQQDQPAQNTPTLPEGNWGVEGDKVTVEDENGNKTDFETGSDYQEPEKGETVTTPIYDENKNQTGTVVIEKDEAGNVTVTPMKPLPEGNWVVTDKEAMVIDPEGNSTIYDTEYEEPENGSSTQAPLYDQDGKPVGSLTVEKDEDGNLTATPNDPAGNGAKKAESSFIPWIIWIAVAVTVAVGGAVTVAVVLKKKKDKDVIKF